MIAKVNEKVEIGALCYYNIQTNRVHVIKSAEDYLECLKHSTFPWNANSSVEKGGDIRFDLCRVPGA